MPITRMRQTRAAVLLAILLVAPACSAGLQRATAIASEELSASTVRLRDAIESQHQSGQLPDADYRSWKRGLGRVAKAGLALNQALRTADRASADVQVRAIIELLDELIREDVIRLPQQTRWTVEIVLQSVRTSLLVISSAL